jgi:DNA-binding MarR family transcriptional regulator
MNTPNRNERMIGALLRIPFQATVRNVQQRLEAEGFIDLRPAHLAVFQHLPPGGARVTELAAGAQITKQSMSALVNYLESHGYIRRMADPADGRASLVCLTLRGMKVEEAARACLRDLESRWVDQLGRERFENLRATLQDLVAVVE